MRILAADHSDIRPTQPGEPFQEEIEQFFADESKYLAGKNMAIMPQGVGRDGTSKTMPALLSRIRR